MAIPPSFPGPRGGQGQRAAAPTITISSDSDVSARSPTVINLSSDDDEVTSRPRSGAARRRTPPPPSSAVSVARSPRPRFPARPSSPAPSFSGISSSGSEATSSGTSRGPKKKRKWCLKDESLVLEIMADLRMRDKNGEIPPASEIWKHLVALRRRGVDARQLSDKMCQLKKKFRINCATAASNGGKLRRRTRHRDKVLYRASQEVWPKLLEQAGL